MELAQVNLEFDRLVRGSDVLTLDKRRALERFFKDFVDLKRYDFAYKVLRYLNLEPDAREKRCLFLAEKCLDEGDYFNACFLYKEAGCALEGYRKSYIARIESERILKFDESIYEENHLGVFVEDELSSILERISALAKEWSLERFGREVKNFRIEGYDATVNAAFHCADNYDLGIAIASAGLTFGFVFEQFGLEIKTLETHKIDSTGLVMNLSSISGDDIRGKKILVIDDAVDSGVTANRIADFLRRLNPGPVDLFTFAPMRRVAKERSGDFYSDKFDPFVFPFDSYGEAVTHFETAIGIWDGEQYVMDELVVEY